MMLNKIWTGAAALVLSVGLTACTVGQAVEVPSREVPISIESALDAQNMAMAGMMAGSVTWDETQFSSLLTELLKANSGANNPVENITAWFEPGVIYLQVDVVDGVLPPAFGDKLAVAGTVGVMDGKLMLDLNQASAGTYKVEGASLAPINAQINGALANLNVGMPIQVETAEGSLTLSMGQ